MPKPTNQLEDNFYQKHGYFHILLFIYLFYFEKKNSILKKINRLSKQKGKKSSETIQNFSTLIEYFIEYLTMFYVIM